MYYSIQHFLENGIPQLEENQKKFMRDPSCFGECVTRVGPIMMGLALQIVSEMLEECDTALRESARRQANWRVRYLYVEADEDHIALQFHEKKGDVRRWKGRGYNGKIVKLVYVHEGYKETGARRKELKGVRYFGGLYPGKENETLWCEVKDYIERTYETEAIERIYFQSDGGGWMKKGVEMLGGTFVLDEFHLRKYVRRMARVAGEEGVMGSSTEGHISHVLSARMSSRPMGWSEEGASKLSRLRIHWKNGEEIGDLLAEPVREEKREEERCLSAEELIRWEKRSQKKNGKYVEALQARVSGQSKMRIYFQQTIGRICG